MGGNMQPFLISKQFKPRWPSRFLSMGGVTSLNQSANLYKAIVTVELKNRTFNENLTVRRELPDPLTRFTALTIGNFVRSDTKNIPMMTEKNIFIYLDIDIFVHLNKKSTHFCCLLKMVKMLIFS